jgi:hypothetical protein
VNLELAKMFIDQLAMIQEKTRGNLTNEESTVLRNALSNLQMVYVEVARETPKGAAQPATAKPEQAAPEQEPSSPPAASSETAPPVTSTDSDTESKKKFTKSYGP